VICLINEIIITTEIYIFSILPLNSSQTPVVHLH